MRCVHLDAITRLQQAMHEPGQRTAEPSSHRGGPMPGHADHPWRNTAHPTNGSPRPTRAPRRVPDDASLSPTSPASPQLPTGAAVTDCSSSAGGRKPIDSPRRRDSLAGCAPSPPLLESTCGPLEAPDPAETTASVAQRVTAEGFRSRGGSRSACWTADPPGWPQLHQRRSSTQAPSLHRRGRAFSDRLRSVCPWQWPAPTLAKRLASAGRTEPPRLAADTPPIGLRCIPPNPTPHCGACSVWRGPSLSHARPNR